MKVETQNKFGVLMAGAGLVVCAILLATAYLPGFWPEAYERARQTRIIMLVPVSAALLVLGSVGLMYISTQKEEVSHE